MKQFKVQEVTSEWQDFDGVIVHTFMDHDKKIARAVLCREKPLKETPEQFPNLTRGV